MTRDRLDPGASGHDDAVSLARDTKEVAYPLLKQGAKSWGEKRLGVVASNGQMRTLSQAGCLLASLEMLRAFLKKEECLRLDLVNEALIAKECFDGPLLYVEKAADAMGIQALAAERYRGTVKTTLVASEMLRQAFADGKLAILHVDHDGTSQRGDLYGDHFIACFAKIGDRYLCGDPAPGALIDIDVGGTGTSQWQTSKGVVEKQYTIVGVIPVSL